ncbi:hypothetical protein H101_07162 [Trichophyton interdigitale H6]|nr:hypothetical protein H101_07162 [Trichophyton interdigitale H6]
MKEKTEEIDIEEGEEEEGEEGDKSASTGHSRGTRAEQLRQSEGQGQQRDEGTDGNDRPRFKGSRAEASKASQREKSSGPGTRVLSRGTGLWRSGRKSTVWPWDTSQGCVRAVWLNQVLARSNAGGGGGGGGGGDDDDDDDAAGDGILRGSF